MIGATSNNPLGLSAPRIDPALLTSRQGDFASILNRAGMPRTDERGRPVEEAAIDPKARAADAARDFVAIALVQPVLAQMRKTNQAAPPFAPGPAEKQFGALVDAQVARQIVRKSNYPLVDRIAADLYRRLAAGETPGGAS